MKASQVSAGPKSPRLPRPLVAAGAAVLLARLLRQRKRMDFRGKSVVITGGSRGLGLEMARLFAGEGARLTLLARDRGELEAARRELGDSEADVLVYPCDVRYREPVDRAVRFILDARGRIDVLVNNAGVIQVGPFDDMDLREYEEAMDVHVWGPLHFIRAVVPHMRRQGGGRIVNIASIGGLVAIPHLLPYTMSKFALVGLSDGVRTELARDGIVVTTVAPGLMRTGSHVNALMKGQQEKEFAWFSTASTLPLFSVSAERAARRIVKACRHGESRLIITPQARLLHAVNALLPGLAAAGQRGVARLLPGPPARGGHRRRIGWRGRSVAAPSILTRSAERAVDAHLEG